jgi:hypothetical protein
MISLFPGVFSFKLKLFMYVLPFELNTMAFNFSWFTSSFQENYLDVQVNSLLYAEGIILLSSTQEGLQNSLNVLSNFLGN